MGTVRTEIRKKGRVFRAEVRREGVRLTRGFGRRTDANNWLNEVESRIVRGEKVPRLKKFTVADAIDRYIKENLPDKRPGTQKLHMTQLLWFKEKLGSKKLSHITSATLSEARELLKSEEVRKSEDGEAFYRAHSTTSRGSLKKQKSSSHRKC